MITLAIDPGTEQSAFVAIDSQNGGYLTVVDKGIYSNAELLRKIQYNEKIINNIVIEMVASYGMPVGKDVFETVYWIGRFAQAGISLMRPVHRVYRKDVKMHLCNSTRARDSNIRQALIDRFGGTGTKKQPNPVYQDGVIKMKKDIWSAFAVGIYFLDTFKNI